MRWPLTLSRGKSPFVPIAYLELTMKTYLRERSEHRLSEPLDDWRFPAEYLTVSPSRNGLLLRLVHDSVRAELSGHYLSWDSVRLRRSAVDGSRRGRETTDAAIKR